MNCNITEDRTIFHKDNLEILQGINSNCIDLIYLDPPFNKKKVFTAPIGRSSAKGASFSDIFREEDVQDEWLQIIEAKKDECINYKKIYTLLQSSKQLEGRSSYNYCYLSYMAIRLIEMHRILKDTGSIYLHCDQTMSHYLKILLDCIFGEKNFRNEIVWCYSRPSAPKQRQLSRVHDILFWYSAGQAWTFNADIIRQPYAASSIAREGYAATASKVATGKVELDAGGKFPESWMYIPVLKGNAKEATGYPTQKPLALLERIIKASSNEGDIVLDPFCGCATTCVAAEKLNRKWIGIDVSEKAYELVKNRLHKEVEEKRDLFDPDKDVHYSTEPPKRTDQEEDYREQAYVYIISNEAFSDVYKVGITTNLDRRLNSYQTGDPYRRYTIEYQLLTPYFKEIETHICNTFECIKNENGREHEWVKGDFEEIKNAIEHFE